MNDENDVWCTTFQNFTGNINGEEVYTSAWLNLSESKKLELTNIFQELNSNCDEDECK